MYYLDWFSAKHCEMFCSHHHKAHKFVTENLFNIICLKKKKKIKHSIKFHTMKLFNEKVMFQFKSTFATAFNYDKYSYNTCFIMMLIRRELTDPSMRTFSFSFLLITTGVRRSSLLLL